MNSCLYVGKVRHRRFAPVEHAFEYRVFLPYLDLDELDQVFRGRWLWSTQRPALARFRRDHYLGDPEVPLSEAVRDRVAEHTGRRPRGPIRLLTHLRYFGYCFNPVSLYYCYGESGEQLETVVAEITNTPWKERFSYVLDQSESRGRPGRPRWKFAKRFHVSPFLDMDYTYDWRFTWPGESLTAHLENQRDGRTDLDATLTLERRPITGPSLAAALLRHPFMTGKVVAAIYWQALRLWRKRCPFFEHPATRQVASS